MAVQAPQGLLDELVERGLLIPGGEPGLFGFGSVFTALFQALDRRISDVIASDAAEAMRFPPVLARHTLERVGYLATFPHLAGSIFAFQSADEDRAEELGRLGGCHHEYAHLQEPTAFVMLPAACYPVYPAIAAAGPLPEGGRTIDAGAAAVFRHEPSRDPARMVSFHQREVVRLGEPDAVLAWRNAKVEQGLALLAELGLAATADVATDPFFGRSGRMLAASQRAQALKVELQVQIAGDAPTAVASFNAHREHFGETFGIVLATGAVAHTACLGYGLERIVLALLATHGPDPSAWPGELRGLTAID